MSDNKQDVKHFGGMGGITGGRAFNQEDDFEVAVEKTMGDTLRADQMARVEMWSALANLDWKHKDGHTASYSFRASGDLVAAICNDGTDYMDYYCQGPDRSVSQRIYDALSSEGWEPDYYDEEEEGGDE